MATIALTEELLLKVARLPKKDRSKVYSLIGREEFKKCQDDPLYWLDASKHVKTSQFPKGMPYVYTRDQHKIYECNLCNHEVLDAKRLVHLEIAHPDVKISKPRELDKYFTIFPAIRQFPMMDYMAPLVDMWLWNQYMAIEKSRDMTATWVCVALSTWDVLFNDGRQHIFQSKDADSTIELVQRADIIYHNHPAFLRSAIGAGEYTIGNNKSGIFRIYRTPESRQPESEILGFPMGPDQIRGLHPSLVFMDEAAFQPLAEEAFAAIKPAINMGGKCLLLSSANRSWFEKICRDRVDEN